MSFWGPRIREDVDIFVDLIESLEGGDTSELQVLLRMTPASAGPTLLIGLEPRGFDHEDSDWAATNGVGLIAAERRRQIRGDGYTPEHDRDEDPNSLALAAAQYALPAHSRTPSAIRDDIPAQWPWMDGSWKPTPDDRMLELVKAGALVAAAIDRLLAEKAEKVEGVAG